MTLQKSRLVKWFILRPVTAGLLVSAFFLGIGGLLAYQRYLLWRNEADRNAMITVEAAKSRLQRSLAYSQAATLSLALSLRNGEIPANIDSLAAELLRENRYIDALQLVPNGVIQYVYPLKGNENVIGYNILEDPTRNKEAFRAMRERKLYFAGPLQLKQGGLGVVGRLPVFTTQGFWGFSAVIIRFQTLLEAAGIDSSGSRGYYFQLSKLNPDSGQEEFFLPVRKSTGRQFKGTVQVADGEWKLSVSPIRDFGILFRIMPSIVLSVLLSLLAGYTIILILKKPSELERLVQQRTEELDQSMEWKKAIIQALPDTLFVIDRENRFANYINPRGNRILTAPANFMHRKVEEVMPAGLSGEMIANIEKVRAGWELITHRYSLEQDGDHFDYEARYTLYNENEVLVLVRDITDQVRAEEKLRESEVKYRTLVEKASDAIFIADFSGRINIVNPAACLLSQYSEAELLTRTIFDFTLPDEINRYPLQFEAIAAGRTATSERKLRRKDGTLIDVEITASKVSDERFLAFIRDISERKKFEMELKSSREQFRQLSNYLENIREEERVNIAREIHDELGQQLTVLKMDLFRLGKGRERDERLEKEKEALLDFVNDIVVTVRKISSQLRPSVLDDLGLDAAMEWYSQEFNKRTGISILFHSRVEDTLLPDKIKTGLFRIFQESLTNILRHAAANEVRISLEPEGDRVLLRIEDNGKGFAPEEIQNKKTLGLLGMKERAAVLKGEYEISSVPGKGTVTTVRVPVASQAE